MMSQMPRIVDLCGKPEVSIQSGVQNSLWHHSHRILQLGDDLQIVAIGTGFTEIPKDILQAKNLRMLNLSGNRIRTIPNSINSFSRLEVRFDEYIFSR